MPGIVRGPRFGLMKYMAPDEIAQYSSDKNIGREVLSLRDARNRYQSCQAIGEGRDPGVVAILLGSDRSQGKRSDGMAGGKGTSARKELAIAVMVGESAVVSRRTRTLGGHLERLSDEEAVSQRFPSQ